MASKSSHCLVFSCDKKYLPESVALLNSLALTQSNHDVHWFGINIPQEVIDQLPLLPYTVHFHNVPQDEIDKAGGISEITCRKRYKYAADIGKDYAGATCLLDADMFFNRDITPYLEWAANTDYILGASLEQKSRYGEVNEHHRVNGEFLLKGNVWNKNDICCAPTIADMKKHASLFRRSWEIFIDGGFKAPDQQSMNMLSFVFGINDLIVPLPNLQFVSSNELSSKPYSRFVHKPEDSTPGGKIWSEAGGTPIYILHGGWFILRYRNQQMLNRIGCINGYIGGSEKCENMARGAIELIYSYFKQCLNGIINIDTTIEYRENAAPGDRALTV
jgi:hypothetical protein